MVNANIAVPSGVVQEIRTAVASIQRIGGPDAAHHLRIQFELIPVGTTGKYTGSFNIMREGQRVAGPLYMSFGIMEIK